MPSTLVRMVQSIVFCRGAEIVACVAFWWARGGGQCEERAQNLYDVECLILLLR